MESDCKREPPARQQTSIDESATPVNDAASPLGTCHSQSIVATSTDNGTLDRTPDLESSQLVTTDSTRLWAATIPTCARMDPTKTNVVQEGPLT